MMNLAVRDIRHQLGRFVLTCLGLGLLLGVVVTMMGIYRGLTAEALALARAVGADLWVVEPGTRGPFAESSRIPGDVRELVARLHGVAAAGAVTYQSVQIEHDGRGIRLYVAGYEPGRPGGPARIETGRGLEHRYELIADRRIGIELGEQVTIGRDPFTVVGTTRGYVTLSGDSVVFMSLRDAQDVQFELAPPAARREAARGAQRVQTNTVNAVVARVSPYVPVSLIARKIQRWKHLSVLTQDEQETLLTRWVIEGPRRQLGLFMVILTAVSAVIIALIIYTMTLDKLREIATLKLIGAPNRTIIGLIVQQAVSMGVVGLITGTALVLVVKDWFPRRVVMESTDLGILFGVVVVVCLAASALGVRVAVRVDPARALVG